MRVLIKITFDGAQYAVASTTTFCDYMCHTQINFQLKYNVALMDHKMNRSTTKTTNYPITELEA